MRCRELEPQQLFGAVVATFAWVFFLAKAYQLEVYHLGAYHLEAFDLQVYFIEV